MTSKHKIIGLTSSLLLATTPLIAKTPITSSEIKNIHNTLTDKIFLGPRGSNINPTKAGESGEGGFDNLSLETNDIAFLTALKVIHAHYSIGKKLYIAEKYTQAESFFGHPISEVLTVLEPAFKHRNINSIGDSMYNLLDIAQKPHQAQALESEIQKILYKIDAIETQIVPKNQKSYLKLRTSIIADLLRRSKLEYFQAHKTTSIGHLQDSIGYFDVAYKMYQSDKDKFDPTLKEKLSQHFKSIHPFFVKFTTLEKDINLKNLAGTIAKIELILLNI